MAVILFGCLLSCKLGCLYVVLWGLYKGKSLVFLLFGFGGRGGGGVCVTSFDAGGHTLYCPVPQPWNSLVPCRKTEWPTQPE